MLCRLLAPLRPRHERLAARLTLLHAPWTWPREDLHAAAAARARELTGSEGPRAPRPGEALLLSCRDGFGGVFPLALPGPGPGAQALTLDAAGTWSAAWHAVGRSARLLWRSPRPRQAGLHAHPLRPLPDAPPLIDPRIPEDGAWTTPPKVLQGDSFGLSFALAQASALWDWPLPLDVAASAEVNASGGLAKVDERGLELKVRAVLRLAPQVRRLLVAEAQAAVARGVVAAALAEQRRKLGVDLELDVVACHDLAAAFDAVRPDLTRDWEATGDDDATRRERIERLVRLALARRDELLDWHPVREAARVAGKTWSRATPDERWTLGFVEAVAARHEGEAVELELPDRAVLHAVPQPRRLELVAHLVQQATDTGAPDPGALVELARPMLLRGAEAFPKHLELQGALGRLLANLARPKDAFEEQLEAARGWVARPGLVGVSYPLAEAYRLAGVLGSPERFEQVAALDREARAEGALGESDLPWVDPPRARALLLLDRLDDLAGFLAERPWDVREPEGRLGPAELVAALCLGRLHHAFALRGADLAKAEAVRSCLAGWARTAELRAQQAAPRGDETLAARRQAHRRALATALALVELDLALARAPGDEDPAAPAGRLAVLHPKLVRFLRARWAPPDPGAWPGVLARVFPYG